MYTKYQDTNLQNRPRISKLQETHKTKRVIKQESILNEKT